MRILFFFLSIGIINFSFGQLIAIPESAQNLVGYNFLGSNYTVSNIQYSGNALALGKFDAAATNIGLNTGIILSTGILSEGDKTGPQGPNDYSNSGSDNGEQGSPFLNSMFNQQTMNAAILEFAFIPNVDSLVLRFIYGSEEYPEYVGQVFIDPMVILISGPGIVGYKNIGVVPNSNAAINVNTLNNGASNNGPCTNCFYYRNNGTGNNSPYNNSDSYIQFDGYTKILEAREMNLVVGDLYYLKIMIADAADAIYDSGIFIESCSTCNFNVGIKEVQGTNFKLYPNPVQNELNISSLNSGNEIKKVNVLDYTGKTVLKTVDFNTKINISDLKTGIYLVQIQSTNGLETIRFVKE